MNLSIEKPQPNCLIVDDEASIRKTISLTLEGHGWKARTCADMESAKKAAQENFYNLALVDLRLGTQSGLDLVPILKESQPGLPIVMITAYASIGTAVEAMRRGASDYLPKPFTPADLRRAADQAMLQQANQVRLRDLEGPFFLESQVPAMQRVLSQARQVAENGNTTVLLRGETGTGKGVLAHAIHTWSPRAKSPFVVVSCPALPSDLLESELFGHVQGAFTGAYRDHEGRVAQADGGTLFLDEIGDLDPKLQAKLLRLLQEKEYERLGDSKTHKADIRVIAATHVDLAAAMRQGKFREDLFYRLSVIELTLPPLKKRLDDLEGLASSMLSELSVENNLPQLRLSAAAVKRMKNYPWQGNLRELRNILERASVFEQSDELQLLNLEKPASATPTSVEKDPQKTLFTLEEMELAHMKRVLDSSKTLEQAAKILGVDPATLWRKRKKHNF